MGLWRARQHAREQAGALLPTHSLTVAVRRILPSSLRRVILKRTSRWGAAGIAAAPHVASLNFSY